MAYFGGKAASSSTGSSLRAVLDAKELCMDGTTVGRRLNLSQAAVSRAVYRGEQIAGEVSLSLEKI